jgi:hypothetical protein
MRRFIPAFITALLIPALAPTLARAQDLGSMYGNSVFQQSVIEMGRPTLEAGQGNVLGDQPLPSAAPTASQQQVNAFAAAYNFQRDDNISRRFRQQFSEIFAPLQPEGREILVSMVQTGQFADEFDRLLGEANHSSTNLIDIMSLYLVLSWEVVNGVGVSPYPEKQQAVRNQLLAVLADGSELVNVSDAAKHELAENMIHTGLLYASMSTFLWENGGRDAAAPFAQNVRSNVVELVGIDLQTVVLSDEGFVAR